MKKIISQEEMNFLLISMISLNNLDNYLFMVKIFFKQGGHQTQKIKGDSIMIELTDSAKEQIDEYFNGKEPSPVRIFLNSGG